MGHFIVWPLIVMYKLIPRASHFLVPLKYFGHYLLIGSFVTQLKLIEPLQHQIGPFNE